jgi:DNA (cytosine-5)-methyltransferase 1
MTAKRKNILEKPSAIDLFSGCGGLTHGLHGAGFNVLAAVEIDSKAQATYTLNHPSVRLYSNDIRSIDPSEMLAELGLKKGELGLLAGCPPCQGFSRLRTRNQSDSVEDHRNDLVKDFLRFAQEMMPSTIMMENVPALEKDGRFLDLQNQLGLLGYECDVKVLDAANYRVPQRRRRLILLASRIHRPKLAPIRSARVTVRQAIKGIGAPTRTKDLLHALPERRSDQVRKIISLIPKNGGSRKDLAKKYQLACHLRSNGFSDVYGRMSWDDVAPTITSGCFNPSKGRFLHPSYNRCITLREAAILQGFPRDYKFDTTHGKEAIALMIGNALPPPFISAHAKGLFTALTAEKT